ncbi:SusC/RagA family TonB-linked outer membrane protein [Geofilum sp. OHC36d9]|uniref:SusC/RagA family TonB-linked outer membrane protein n=1 Tax=Geofilum sp. OHC36d9 TaxID=3458413 RepID=UPI0040339DA5
MIMNRHIELVETTKSFVLYKLIVLLLAIGILRSPDLVMGQNEIPDSLSLVKIVVRDAYSKKPIPAVQVKTINSLAAGTSDENGELNIAVTSGNEVLEIKAFDYKLQEVPVRGRNFLEVELYPDFFLEWYKTNDGLDGHVRSSHNPLSTYQLQNISKSPAITIEDLLQKNAGGDVKSTNRSGLAGVGASMFIRGFNSINANSQPLFVVDGVIWNMNYNEASLHYGYFGNKLADIDVNDIGSVTVLKDGTSIYGSKGANGVVFIKTKRAQDMVTKIEFNAFGGISEKPNKGIPMMSGDEYRIYLTELLGTSEFSNNEIAGMPFLNDDPSYLEYNKYHNVTDWDDEVYKTGILQSYNINVTGGDEKALYFFSLGYTGENGVVKSTDMERLNTRFNADFDLTERFDMGLNIGFTNVDRNLLDDGVSFYTSPTYLALIKSSFLSPYTYTPDGTLTSDYEDADVFGIGNPSAIINNSLNTNNQYRLNFGVKPSFIITPTLKLSSLFDYTLDKVKETYYSPMTGVATRYIEGYGLSENVFKGQIIRSISIFDDTQLTFSGVINNQHHINATLGWRYLVDNYRLEYGEGHNSGSDQKRNLLNEEEYKSTMGVNNDSKYLSTYINADYNLNNKYFLTTSLAVDGSSRFGNETKGGFRAFDRSWGVFPSVNFAWLISSENFIGDTKILNHLKLRAGWGISGNDDISPYAAQAYFVSSKFMNRANGLILGGIANSEIQWETTYKYNVGLDAYLFNNRLGLSVDLYNNNTNDLLVQRSYPDIVGDGYYWNNEGEMNNKGAELAFRWKVLNQKHFKWELNASIGHYQNEITSLPNGSFITSFNNAEILTAVGNPVGVFYGYKTNGVLVTQNDANEANLSQVNSVDGSVTYFSAGDILFVDQERDGVIDEKDKQIIGDPNPDFYGSFSSKIGYKNLTLNAYFKFSSGNDVYNYQRYTLESGRNYSNQSVAMLNRWTADGQQTNQPKVVFGDPMGNARFSDRWIEDASFIRLKSIQLNYKIPINSQILETLEIWTAANNLWTLTNYLGVDPEVSSGNSVLYQGIDFGLLPNARSFVIGLKMNL